MIPIVDTHQHLWDLTRFRLPWNKAGSPLARNFLMVDYLNATAGLNIIKAIYMEVDVEPEQQTAEAQYILDICQRGKGPTVAAVISGRPASDGFRKYLDQFKGNRYIRGVRQVLHNPEVPAGYCLNADFIKGIRLLGERGMSFDICVRPGELTDAAKLVAACPDTRFILDHCGNANVQATDHAQWKRDMATVASHKNVVGKVSGIVVSAKRGAWTEADLAPLVNHTLDVFGPDRVMFGGDWPVCTMTATYKQWVEALKNIVHHRTEQEQRKLFHDNAMQFYGLA
ncbi:MAG TPA: amidohydrolase family protein [Gemmataceae bacterium]|nr:amidohydrolase family protein [Gemmataceae bacterium]